MKKHLLQLAIIALASSLPASAKDLLSEITSESGVVHYSFVYNDRGQVTRQDNSDDFGDYYMIFSYNDLNQLIRNDTYQDFQNSGEFTLVSYVEYKYDEQGRLCQRENYNYDQWSGGGYLKGARITYSYDEQGNMTEQIVYMAWGEEENLAQKIEYSYNEDGFLAKELTLTADFFDPSIVTPSYQIAYTYDEEGRRSVMTDYYFDTFGENPDEPVLQGYTNYAYDNNGLCLYERVTPAGRTDSKNEYTFLPESIDETIYPYDIEAKETSFVYENVKNRIDLRTEYATDMNSGDLMVYDKYYYHYTPDPSGVGAVTMPESILNVRQNGDNIIIGGLDTGDKVTVYDLGGKPVASVTASAPRISTTALTPGTYIAVSPTGVVKFNVK